LNGCGALLKSGIYNGSNAVTATSVTPVFVTSSPLPLTLLDFNAAESNGHVALDWRTAMEVNVKNFDVEWSLNNSAWSNIATVTAKNQNINNYNSLHTDPIVGRNYYRLKMRDMDGRVNISETKIVNITKSGNSSPVLVPNPVSSESMLYFSKSTKQTTIKIYDAAGSLVRKLVAEPGVQQMKITSANLANGVYIIETTGTYRHITRMVVQK
jgi:extracellular elastinolytic metalloproteinase